MKEHNKQANMHVCACISLASVFNILDDKYSKNQIFFKVKWNEGIVQGTTIFYWIDTKCVCICVIWEKKYSNHKMPLPKIQLKRIKILHFFRVFFWFFPNGMLTRHMQHMYTDI